MTELAKEAMKVDKMQKKVLTLIHKLYNIKNPEKAKEEAKNDYLVEVGPIENLYIVSNYTMPQIAKLFDMGIDSLYQYCTLYNWAIKRRDYQQCYKQELQDTLKKSVITTEIQINQRHYNLWNTILDYTEKELKDKKAMSVIMGPYKGKLNVNKLMNLCTIINQAQSGQRITLGLASAEKMIDEQIATDRLELEKVKLGIIKLDENKELNQEPDITETLKDSIKNIWGDKKKEETEVIDK